jgi:hypothetical protein
MAIIMNTVSVEVKPCTGKYDVPVELVEFILNVVQKQNASVSIHDTVKSDKPTNRAGQIYS